MNKEEIKFKERVAACKKCKDSYTKLGMYNCKVTEQPTREMKNCPIKKW